MAWRAVVRWFEVTWVLFMLLGCGWCTWKTMSTIYFPQFNHNNNIAKKRIRTRTSSGAAASSPTAINPRTQNTDAKRTQLLTVLSSVLFTLTLMLFLCSFLVLMDDMGWDSNDSWKSENKSAKTIKVETLGLLGLYIVSYAYAAHFYLAFERLRSVFKDSSMFRLSNCIIKSMRVYASLMVVSFSVAYFPYLFLRIIIPGMDRMVFLWVLTYFIVSFWICYRFYQSINGLISNIDSTNAASASSSMLNASLRITIITLTALMSTLLMNITGLVCVAIATAIFGEQGYRYSWSGVQ